MALRRSTWLPVLIVSLAAFAATFAILRSTGARVGGGTPSYVAEGSVALPTASTDQRIAILQRALRDHPGNVDTSVLLAAAYLQKVRETGDASLYGKADGLIAGALRAKPGDVGAITERGALELSRHDF